MQRNTLSLITRLSVGTTILLGLLLAQSAAAATILFENGFEEGDFSAWDLSGADWTLVKNSGGAHSGEYRAEGEGGETTGSVLVKYLDVSGFENITLSFWYQLPGNGFESGEDMDVDYTLDGGVTWSNLKRFLDGDEIDEWTFYEAMLPAGANDDSHFGIRFQTNAANASDIFKLDDVLLTGESIEVSELEDKAECKKGGWEALGFKNQGQCIRLVNTGVDSRE